MAKPKKVTKKAEVTSTYAKITPQSRKKIAENSREWTASQLQEGVLRQMRLQLEAQTLNTFDEIFEQLKADGVVKSKTDTFRLILKEYCNNHGIDENITIK